MDASEAYRDSRLRITELATSLDSSQLETTVPACPEWRVVDLFAHLAGVAADLLANNFTGGDDWTAAQVGARKGKSVAEIAAEWDDLGPQVEERMGAMPPQFAGVLLADIATHEQDLRGAVGVHGGEDSPAIDGGLQFAIQGLDRRLKKANRPALRVVAAGGDQEWIIGDGEPQTSVTAEPFELLRAIIGRRTDDQVRAYKWEGDPTPYLPVFGAFARPPHPLPI